MRVVFHKNFEKKYKRLRSSEKDRFKKILNTFIIDPFYPTLNNHVLSGKYGGFRSINIGGDLRAIYKMLDNDMYLFVTIDSHSNLYE
ncbi:MAG: type II toxin-antitoxin system mRNA interferase toxin, RelE/StbE family [Minisyncoccia bacterium]